MTDVLLELAACERRKDFSQPRGARFTGLAARPSNGVGADEDEVR
jgi:hypothetical protein